MAHWTNSSSMNLIIDDLRQQLSGQEVTIIGHNNIDVDACLSGILLSNLLSFWGINNRFAILQPVKEDDTFQIIQKLIGMNIKIFYCPIEDETCNLFLVDHYETFHNGQVLGCIDHHPTLQENTYNFSYARKCTSTTYMIYEIMRATGYPISELEAKMIIVGMMVDTVAFTSTKAIFNEREDAYKLAMEYAFDYEYLRKETMCLTPIDEMSDDEIILNGHKEYLYGHQFKVTSSYLQLYGLPNKKQIKKWLTMLYNVVRNNEVKNHEYNMFVFLIFDLESKKTYEYHIHSHMFYSDPFAGYAKVIVHDGIFSRGQDIMPEVEKLFVYHEKDDVDRLIESLFKKYMTISAMESCTGGSFAGTITNHSGASDIMQESLVSYSNRAKIEFGVPEETIDKYTVYSPETAKAMARAVKIFCKADIGVGITGKLCTSDSDDEESNIAWYAIETDEGVFTERCIMFLNDVTRPHEKELIIQEIVTDLVTIFC